MIDPEECNRVDLDEDGEIEEFDFSSDVNTLPPIYGEDECES